MKPKTLTIFYDGGCDLCRREIQHYIRLDREHKVLWVDIASAPDRLAEHGVKFTDAMAQLHGVNSDGHLLRGVDTFVAIWQTLPRYRWLAAVTRPASVKSILDAVYRRFANWRFERRCKAATCSRSNSHVNSNASGNVDH